MKQATITRERVREVDRRAVEEYGMPSIVLMENAGRNVAQKLLELGVAGNVVIFCGKGNNAGDGFVIARHLDLARINVKVLLWAKPADLTGDAAINYRILQRSGVTIEVFGSRVDQERLQEQRAGAAWFVDAMLGTGAQGDPRPPFDEVIDWLNGTNVPKLAVDLPSGLDCDTGQPSAHTVRASHTCTFVAAKVGFAAASEYTGQVHVIDIGVPRKLVERMVGHTP